MGTFCYKISHFTHYRYYTWTPEFGFIWGKKNPPLSVKMWSEAFPHKVFSRKNPIFHMPFFSTLLKMPGQKRTLPKMFIFYHRLNFFLEFGRTKSTAGQLNFFSINFSQCLCNLWLPKSILRLTNCWVSFQSFVANFWKFN